MKFVKTLSLFAALAFLGLGSVQAADIPAEVKSSDAWNKLSPDEQKEAEKWSGLDSSAGGVSSCDFCNLVNSLMGKGACSSTFGSCILAIPGALSSLYPYIKSHASTVCSSPTLSSVCTYAAQVPVAGSTADTAISAACTAVGATPPSTCS